MAAVLTAENATTIAIAIDFMVSLLRVCVQVFRSARASALGVSDDDFVRALQNVTRDKPTKDLTRASGL
jgi:hypothetical protein